MRNTFLAIVFGLSLSSILAMASEVVDRSDFNPQGETVVATGFDCDICSKNSSPASLLPKREEFSQLLPDSYNQGTSSSPSQPAGGADGI
jgi:hypothetical protein